MRWLLSNPYIDVKWLRFRPRLFAVVLCLVVVWRVVSVDCMLVYLLSDRAERG